jgi:hypothetical protein
VRLAFARADISRRPGLDLQKYSEKIDQLLEMPIKEFSEKIDREKVLLLNLPEMRRAAFRRDVDWQYP